MHFGFALTVNGNKMEMFMNNNLKSFTMAEILLSLTIIGVVAAITLPSLTGNINERTWQAQKKALYARMSQAIALMPYINGYGVGQTNSETSSNAAKAFVTEGLSKVLKINNICDNAHLSDCGFKDKIKATNGSVYSIPKTINGLKSWVVGNHSETVPNFPQYFYSYSILNTNAVAFETHNGESILTFYKPKCISKEMLMANNRSYYPSAPYICANFLYDLNGKKGPNTVGKDIGFITVLYSANPVVVAPDFFDSDTPDIGSSTEVNDSAIQTCRAQNGRLPTTEEAMSLFLNGKFLNLVDFTYYRAVGKQTDGQYAKIHSAYGTISTLSHGAGSYKIRCVKK